MGGKREAHGQRPFYTLNTWPCAVERKLKTRIKILFSIFYPQSSSVLRCIRSHMPVSLFMIPTFYLSFGRKHVRYDWENCFSSSINHDFERVFQQIWGWKTVSEVTISPPWSNPVYICIDFYFVHKTVELNKSPVGSVSNPSSNSPLWFIV